ncbi:MAG: hypothetical protein ACI9D5_000184, partial [Candidatus Endobugula sp.]
MLDSNVIGKIISVKDNDTVLIVRASSGEQVVAKGGELLAKGDTVIVGDNSYALIDIDYLDVKGVGIIRDGEVAKLDDALFDRANSLLASSSVEDPVNIGLEPTLDIIQLFNKMFTAFGTTIDTNAADSDEVSSDPLFIVERNFAETLPENGGVQTSLLRGNGNEEGTRIGDAIILDATVDNETAPEVSIAAGVDVTEGTNSVFTVNLDQVSQSDVTVDVTYTGTA